MTARRGSRFRRGTPTALSCPASAQPRAWFIRPIGASTAISPMTQDAPGHFSGVTEAALGQWDVVIELSRDGDRLFRSKNRIVLR